jgi:hypothetical protein
MKLSRHLLAGFTALTAVVAAGAAAPAVAFAQIERIVVNPPAPRVEVLTARPGPYHVWQAGNWAWHPEGRYVWHPGRWVIPPQGRTVWVKDEWISHGGSWHFVPGHWRAIGEPIPTVMQRLTVTAEPPAEQVEVVGAVPEGHAWIKGHWSWDGLHYVWVPGHHMLVPEGFHAWEPGHWYAAGGRWFYRGGYWR